MMSEDEDDYMSDKFLNECCNASTDVRPGLINLHSEKRQFRALKRKHEQDELNRKKNPNLKLLESEKRKEGLQKPIEENNKGFALLQKMGYRPGDGLGRKDAGRTEPIPIVLKADREGLGRARLKQEIYEEHVKDLRACAVSTSEYRTRMTEKAAQRQVENDFHKSQRVCERLDAENSVHEPMELWYWFSTDPENNAKPKRKPKRIVKRKRGSDSEDEEFMDDTNDDAYDYDEEEEEDDSDDEDEVCRSSISIGINEKLWDVTTYLRNEYFYCIWCSVKYNDIDDLRKECPGRTKDEH